jgi:hypothetical protein
MEFELSSISSEEDTNVIVGELSPSLETNLKLSISSGVYTNLRGESLCELLCLLTPGV